MWTLLLVWCSLQQNFLDRCTEEPVSKTFATEQSCTEVGQRLMLSRKSKRDRLVVGYVCREESSGN
jgi:hypothetical protein